MCGIKVRLLHPTYPLAIHFEWMVGLISMWMGVGQMMYLMLVIEKLIK